MELVVFFSVGRIGRGDMGYQWPVVLYRTFVQHIAMDTTAIVVFGIVMLHILMGFGYVIYKLNHKPAPKNQQENSSPSVGDPH